MSTVELYLLEFSIKKVCSEFSKISLFTNFCASRKVLQYLAKYEFLSQLEVCALRSADENGNKTAIEQATAG